MFVYILPVCFIIGALLRTVQTRVEELKKNVWQVFEKLPFSEVSVGVSGNDE